MSRGSRGSSRNGRPPSMHQSFTSFGDYMHEKFRKNQEENGQIAAVSGIFAGIVLYFDGYLGPSRTMLEWKALVLQHSAKVIDMLTPDITHIIAENLTDRKIDLWKNKKVAKSQWIDDCIAAGKLLPWYRYRTSSSRMSGQTSALDFARRKQDGTLTSTSPIKLPVPETEGIVHPVHGHQSASSSAQTSHQPLSRSSDFVTRNIATADGFLAKYYSSSRLSKISNWKSDLKDFVAAKLKERKTDNSHITAAALEGKRLRTIFHVDMDCFFASVSLLAQPQLKKEPVVICHTTGPTKTSTSEIASCNYIARASGVRNGMFLGKATSLCPTLKVLPYDFESYDRVSRALYQILLDIADDVMAVSCDEAFIDVSSLISQRGTGEVALAERIRKAVLEQTGCSASIGIGDSMLTARVATRKAKPDGVFLLAGTTVQETFRDLAVGDLPGIGYMMVDKLRKLNVVTCGDISSLTLQACKRHFGEVNGQKLWEFSRGVDKRPLENKSRQSVSAEVNWGVRFENETQAISFIYELCREVEGRLKRVNVLGRQITFKLKRKLYDGEPMKFLGCGHCADLSKSFLFDKFVDDADLIHREAVKLFRGLDVPATEIRGVGIQVSKLMDRKSMPGQPVLSFAKRKSTANPSEASINTDEPPHKLRRGEAEEPPKFFMPANLMEMDPEVFAALPENIRSEIMAHFHTDDAKLHENTRQEPPPFQPQAKVHLSNFTCSPTHQSLLGQGDSGYIRELMRKWVDQSDLPLDSDIDIVLRYLTELMDAWRFDESRILLESIGTLVQGKSSKPWKTLLQQLNKLAIAKEVEFLNQV
ncbi:hypothetical protein DFJ73DRAFT_861879 [Zopfochytrium polystomum]|nr:hypothetical protein DFJ73DRAFT_861879 [Zopfochytrium polystomum]